ncbi:MAG: uroporphyrinogen-III C-methyltransferase [Gammaproteobacteria bacterium]
MSDKTDKQPGKDKPEQPTAKETKPGPETVAGSAPAEKQAGKEGARAPAEGGAKGEKSKQATAKGAGPKGPEATGRDTGQAPAKPRRSRIGLFLVLLLIIAAAAAGGGAWYLWQRLQQQDQAFTRQVAALQDKLPQTRSDQRAATTKLENQLRDLRERQRSARNAIEVLRAKSGRSEAEWRVAEAEYLIRVANYRLELERDVGTALAALQAADERLRRAGDPALLEARKQIAHDIQSLRSVDQPDLPGLSLALGGLIDEVGKLPLNTPRPGQGPSAGSSEAGGAAKPEANKGWRDALKGMWHELKGLVVVRHPKQATQPLLPPSERFFLTENLRLQLEQARLALMRGDAADYRQRIETAQRWIRAHFDVEAPATRGALDTLARLAKQDVHPKLPDISAPLRTLAQYRAKLHQGAPSRDASATGAKASGPTSPAEAGAKAVVSHPRQVAELLRDDAGH